MQLKENIDSIEVNASFLLAFFVFLDKIVIEKGNYCIQKSFLKIISKIKCNFLVLNYQLFSYFQDVDYLSIR